MKIAALLLTLLVLFGAVCATKWDWNLYKRRYGKSYASQEEDAARYRNYMATKQRIERHNAADKRTFSMGLNHFADWSSEELAGMHGLKYDASRLDQLRFKSTQVGSPLLELLKRNSAPLPDEVDWRKVPGRVTGVKDQGHCGSCWAFATTGVLEGQEISQNISGLGTGRDLIPLSEQELVDCSSTNNGCEGGFVYDALEDLSYIGGIEDSNDYPYEKQKGDNCRFQKSKAVMQDAGGMMMPPFDEEMMKQVVAEFGPVATGIYATESLVSYKGGVFYDESCPKGETNHAVLIVGYGTDPKHGDYWLIKNSWSEHWGEKGYFRVVRGKNVCALADYATVPTF